VTDFLPLPAQLVALIGQPRRFPSPLGHGKREELGSRNNSGIARIQARLRCQIGETRRSERENFIFRQSRPNPPDLRGTSRQYRRPRNPNASRAIRVGGCGIKIGHPMEDGQGVMVRAISFTAKCTPRLQAKLSHRANPRVEFCSSLPALFFLPHAAFTGCCHARFRLRADCIFPSGC